MGTKSAEVAEPLASTGRTEENTSTVQAASLKSRKVMVPDFGPLGPSSEAVSRTAVPTGPPGDADPRTVGVALAMVRVNVWHADGPPLLAHTVVGPKVPAADGVPSRIPPVPRLSPGGRAPLVTV